MFTYILYAAAVILLILSYIKDKHKTRTALKKAWKSFENVLPPLLSVLFIIGIILSVLTPETISKLLGEQSGILGLTIAAVIGSITLIPGFVAFPLAATLLKAGAGYGQITMFISTLMMVGIVTLPVERKYFGDKISIKRNIISFLFAICISVIIGGILK